jgi:hypothetical protein
MAERPRVNPVAIVARIARGPVGKDCEAEAEIALATLDFLDAECRESGCDPGPTAHFVVLDLAAALLAFGAVRNVEELVHWLRKEAPARAPVNCRKRCRPAGGRSATRRRVRACRRQRRRAGTNLS